MNSDLLASVAAAGVVAVLAVVSFARGRRRRPALLPPDLVAELSHHKLACLHEPPERVALELALLVGRAHPHEPPAPAGRAGSDAS